MEVWADGSANSSGVGWAVVCPSTRTILRGKLEKGPAVKDPTNQRAELSAVIQAIFYFGPILAGRLETLVIYTDSTYTIGCFTKWYQNWLQNGWKNASKKPVDNQDLIKLGLSLKANLVIFKHVKGHSGDLYNEMADYYANVGVSQLAHPGWSFLST